MPRGDSAGELRRAGPGFEAHQIAARKRLCLAATVELPDPEPAEERGVKLEHHPQAERRIFEADESLAKAGEQTEVMAPLLPRLHERHIDVSAAHAPARGPCQSAGGRKPRGAVALHRLHGARRRDDPRTRPKQRPAEDGMMAPENPRGRRPRVREPLLDDEPRLRVVERDRPLEAERRPREIDLHRKRRGRTADDLPRSAPRLAVERMTDAVHLAGGVAVGKEFLPAAGIPAIEHRLRGARRGEGVAAVVGRRRPQSPQQFMPRLATQERNHLAPLLRQEDTAEMVVLDHGLRPAAGHPMAHLGGAVHSALSVIPCGHAGPPS